jgi:hypothetical protein
VRLRESWCLRIYGMPTPTPHTHTHTHTPHTTHTVPAQPGKPGTRDFSSTHVPTRESRRARRRAAVSRPARPSPAPAAPIRAVPWSPTAMPPAHPAQRFRWEKKKKKKKTVSWTALPPWVWLFPDKNKYRGAIDGLRRTQPAKHYPSLHQTLASKCRIAYARHLSFEVLNRGEELGILPCAPQTAQLVRHH